MLSAVWFQAAAQSASVSGVVRDASGPLVGVNVTVDGTVLGTTTASDGRYSITVTEPEKATLVFSYLGYEEQRIAVAQRTRIDVTLVEAANAIDELIVIGYGYQRKSDVATSVSSVKTDDMKSFPTASIGEMLRGRAAGLQVTTSSGRPGSAPDIKIRGTRSISAGNEPLYIIDGTPATAAEFGTLNADDVSSVEILKDAAAQAIYGARASDGVILVTTKRGAEGRTEVSYNGYVGIQRLWR